MTHPSKKQTPETEQEPLQSTEETQPLAPEQEEISAVDPIFHIGWRIYKTGFAALICILFSHALGGFPFFAVIAALICMKPTLEDSFNVGIHRVIGTIIGGITGMAMLSFFRFIGWERNSLPYDLLTVVVMMFLIKFIAVIGRNQATIITCVVYTSILLMPLIAGQSIVQYSMMRVLDTLLGVVVALIINEVLPNHYKERQPVKETETDAADATAREKADQEPTSPDDRHTP